MMFDEEAIEADKSLSGVNPVIVEDRYLAWVTDPLRRAVLTPTMLETEFGFLRELIVKRTCWTAFVVDKLIVAT